MPEEVVPRVYGAGCAEAVDAEVVARVYGAGCATERAHQLEDVIDNVERDGDFYAKANLSLKMGERDHLYELYSSS